MLKYYKYHLPFTSPLQISGKKFFHRDGVILTYKDPESGHTAFGEIAPLPGFSTEEISEVIEVLRSNRGYITSSIKENNGKEALRVLDRIHRFPSLSFGLDTLLHDLTAKREERSLAKYLFKEFGSNIQCNATIGIQEVKTALKKADEFIEAGYNTLKIKVGYQITREYRIVKQLRETYPDLKIRLDANQAWLPDEAIKHLNSLEKFDIEYCEQPVLKDDIYGLKRVTDAVTIPIAADESLRNKRSAKELSFVKAVDMVIIKPTLMGTYQDIFVTKEIVDTHVIEAVLTTALESAIGRAAIATLSAGLGDPKYAQGLATGSFLKKDLSSDSWLNSPIVEIPEEPGLGINIDMEGLEEL
ncbi:o-succinylbenzoate synthase [Gracilimonas sp. Q87]|uniref:o-succinylbenzoate synthase n=1 Tax=Gracilimonas sp. Q87 TaxID=3384766 RepID=UPI003984599C